MPGDSGAWVIDNEQGRVCGHVLAWCSRNKWAYICPMQILLEDMERALPASKVSLPGAERSVVVPSSTTTSSRARARSMSNRGLPLLQQLSSPASNVVDRSGAGAFRIEHDPGVGASRQMVMEGTRVSTQMAKG